MSTQLFSEIEKNLKAYKPTETLEKEYLVEFEKLLLKGPQALWSDHFDPGHITASGYVLSPDRQSVLMIMHTKIQRWLQPGGHLEKSDTSLLEAVQREVVEETGIGGTERIGGGIFDIDIHVIRERPGKPSHLHYDIRLLLQSMTTDFTTTEEAREIRWIELEQAKKEFSDLSILRPVAKAVTLEF